MSRARTRFRYRAARRDGTIEFGIIDVEDRGAVASELAARGVLPLEITAQSGNQASSRLCAKDLGLGFRIMASLLESGLPIGKALAAFSELAPKAWRGGLETIRSGVREGSTLASALEGSSLEIPATMVGMIRAGEAAGRLPASVRSAAELAERQAAARAALHAALAYPLVLAAAAISAIVLLVGVVVPRFARILEDVGGTLPPSTRAVVGVANASSAAALPVLLGAAGLVLLWHSWTKTEDGRRAWHTWLLAVPGLGSVRRSAATSRFCGALAALLESGVPLAPALSHAASAVGDAAVAAATTRARAAVIQGQSLSFALETEHAATPTVIRLVRAGEESGNVGPMLVHAARIEAEHADHLTKGALRLVEPLMILLFGGLVAIIAAALLQALYSMRPAS
ncbi:MAG TPA: type II secretion system F family protein [Gemmatimonadaceae bacterium]|jgi:type II secretory pathway component PulF|nr:type II secretion system F family protein [Gemmatimonadaceae bacterium]